MVGKLILVVDDDRSVVDVAKAALEAEGFQVESASSGTEALDKFRLFKPSLIVLDIMLPGLDGLEVCRRIRAESDTPIIMLTAKGEDVDKIVGLELGADDYVTKPFNPRELVARVKAVLRRYEKGLEPARVVRLGDLVIDPASREVTLKGNRLELRRKEFDLLLTLARHKNIVLTREQLLNLVWGYDFYGTTRTVDVHVARLREKLAGSNVVIETVHGVGYRLVVEK
ncbi:MAG: DNA-binding response regulator [Chloroflexi bacterium]|nr:MAG: DNA-binding response regulator [Chloroflexota bacterium]